MEATWAGEGATSAGKDQMLAAVKAVGLQVPLVVRLEGTNVELGREILEKSGLPIITATTLSDAAQKIVEATRGNVALMKRA